MRFKGETTPPESAHDGYQGVKFEKTGRNGLAATYLIQLQGEEYQLVWPAAAAIALLQWPMQGSVGSAQ